MAGIDPKYYYLTLGLLALCTLAGLIISYQFQREVNEDLAPPTEKDLLGPLEKAYYSGLMRPEEFERIQASMARQKTEGKGSVTRASKPRVKPEADPGEVEKGSAEEPPPPITPTVESDPGPSPD